MRPCAVLLCISLCSCQLSCEALPPRVGINTASADAPLMPGTDNYSDPQGSAPDYDEVPPEDQEALDELIFSLSEKQREGATQLFDPQISSDYTRHELVPRASENSRLSTKECRRRLNKLGVETISPKFDTPLVQVPLLLKSPIAGVDIVPRWPKKKPVNEVMDCHLLLALVDVAHRAKALGVIKIEYYSAYRPLTQPPKNCRKGKRGRRCREKQKKYKKLVRGKLSQHRRALGIDIRWLTLADGTVLDVLEDYDRRDGTPPCSYEADNAHQRLLQEFACGLHRDQVFNVVLTPNANKDHHNHFHFDITPKVGWHIAQ